MNRQENVQKDDFDKIDYTETSDEIKSIFETKPHIYLKTSNIVSDTKQLLVRIPKKIQEQYNIKKGDKMNFRLTVNNPEKPSENTIEITIDRCNE